MNGKKRCNIHIIQHYSAIKRKEIMPLVATWMNPEIIILTEVSQKERQMPSDIKHMWNLKYDTN